ncbi:Nn.00g006570.m01.CDS01 [Neocucurbitaria sp. VM-36]
MEIRGILSYHPSQYQGVMDLTPSHETYRHQSHNSVAPDAPQESSDEVPVCHSSIVLDYSSTPVTSGAEDTFDPWLLIEPPCGSPLSSSSSIGPSESVSTPSYTGQVSEPLYHLLEEPVPHALNNLTGSFGWVENVESGCNWQRQYSDDNVWNVQTPLPPWSGSDYMSAPLPPLPPLPPIEPCPQLVSNNTTPSISQSMPNLYANHPVVDSAPFNLAHATSAQEINAREVNAQENSSDESDSGSGDSEYEGMDCSYDHATSSRSTSSYKHKSNRVVSPVLKLGKWTMDVDTYTQPEQRHYICHFSRKPDPVGRICHQRFVRPEHLRRHIKTVHGNERGYPCKVPQCNRAFSRGDNLRDHYWTHLSRGGRAGRNDKMSLEELKAILGSKEKKLVRRLKQKLYTQMEKSWVKVPRMRR